VNVAFFLCRSAHGGGQSALHRIRSGGRRVGGDCGANVVRSDAASGTSAENSGDDGVFGRLDAVINNAAIDITAPIGENVRRVAKARSIDVADVTVCVLDRPRHDKLVQSVRETGARIHFISDGDVAGAISAARPGTGVDMLLGIGGTPEGIITAAALKCMGGAIQARLWPRDYAEREKALAAGHDLDRVLETDDLVSGDNVFFCATGVTDGDLLRGVHYTPGGCTTQSIVMRSKSGTVRMIDGYHRLTKLRAYSSVDYDIGEAGAVGPPPRP